ncbi:MAG: NAD(P)/FAD-dependent oxidoreductase [Eubacterium sp.]|nr:NAD(P)/FAD-dependent oxidoreductase [Eubacterium sp.]
MVAAISAARRGSEVIIIEHMERVGRKILSTGNGKCNYTNRRQGLRCYRGENPAFVLPVLEQFGVEETIAFFKELGVFPRERDGYFYPASGQASSVLDVLRMELRRLQIEIHTDCAITSVQRTKHGFDVRTTQGAFRAHQCIFACGGRAFPKSGSDGSAYPYIEKLGHTLIEMVPALVPMKAKQSFFKSVAGIRADARICLYRNGKQIAKDRGEIQLTQTGVSGIPAFQVSRYAARALAKKEKVRAELDFAPDLSEEELAAELTARFAAHNGKSLEESLIGFFPKKLILLFLKENRLPLQEKAEWMLNGRISSFARYIKHVTIDVTETEGFDRAQSSAGGVDTKEINPKTLESYLVQGLFFAGEVIDIDGMCGGYNLQWAWSSGYVAGMHAADRK